MNNLFYTMKCIIIMESKNFNGEKSTAHQFITVHRFKITGLKFRVIV